MRKIVLPRRTSQHCTHHSGISFPGVESLSRKHTLKDTEDRPRVVTVKKTDEADGVTFVPLPSGFLLIPSIKGSLGLLAGLRTQLLPLRPAAQVQQRESSQPDHSVLLQVRPIFVSQPAQIEKLPPRDPLHSRPHGPKRLAYRQPLRDPRLLQSRRSQKVSLLSPPPFSPRNHLHSRPLLLIQTLVPSPRKPPTTLRLCGPDLPNLNNLRYPQHLPVYLLLPDY